MFGWNRYKNFSLEIKHKDKPLLEDYEKLRDLYKELQMLDSQKISQQLLGLKQRLFEYQDKPGKCLAYLLAEITGKQQVISMQHESGKLVVSPEQKLAVFSEYYTRLYTSEYPSAENIDDLFFDLQVPIVLEEYKAALNQPISVTEIIGAIDRLKVNKAPGPDGLTSEFYKIFKLFLAPRLQKFIILLMVPKTFQLLCVRH